MKRCLALLLLTLGATGALQYASQSEVTISPIHFEDVAGQSGISFILHNCPTPQKHMIETMPGGIAVFDYDGDGRPISTSPTAPTSRRFEKPAPKYWNRLYRNEGNWKFRDVTEQAGVAGAGYSMGAAAADYDNDGHPDLFVAGVNRNILYHNLGNGQVRRRHRQSRHRERRVGRRRRLVRLRPRRQTRPLGRPLRQVVRRRRPLLRRLLTRHPHLLPSEIFQRPGQHALSQSRRRHLSRTSPRRPASRNFAGRGMSVAFADYDGDGYPGRLRHE